MSGPPGLESLGDARGDLSLFVRSARDLIKGPPVTCAPATPVSEAARLMTERDIDSVVIADATGAPLGIVTDHDLRSRVVARGLPGDTPVAGIMSSPLRSVGPAVRAFEALLEMTRGGFHHLGVVEEGRLIGVVSSHDMLGLQAAHPVGLAREIDTAESLDALIATAPRLQRVVGWLAGVNVGALEIGRIIAELNDRLVRRTLALVESALEREGVGRPPVAYAWLAVGSEGRREQTLRTDQDNGLVYADPAPDRAGDTEAYFTRFAEAAGAALARLGFPPCPGGFMASNPRWRRPLSSWLGEFADWMDTPEPKRLLFASLYCDLRPLAGDEALAGTLRSWLCERAPSAHLFLSFMARDALERRPPLGLLGGFAVSRSGPLRGRLDLKAGAIFPVTQALRVYALSLGVPETSTLDRLAAAEARGAIRVEEARDLRQAFEVVSRLRLGHQLEQLDAGLDPDNWIDPARLGKSDRLLLKEAFKTVGWLQRMLEDRFQTNLVS